MSAEVLSAGGESERERKKERKKVRERAREREEEEEKKVWESDFCFLCKFVQDVNQCN